MHTIKPTKICPCNFAVNDTREVVGWKLLEWKRENGRKGKIYTIEYYSIRLILWLLYFEIGIVKTIVQSLIFSHKLQRCTNPTFLRAFSSLLSPSFLIWALLLLEFWLLLQCVLRRAEVNMWLFTDHCVSLRMFGHSQWYCSITNVCSGTQWRPNRSTHTHQHIQWVPSICLAELHYQAPFIVNQWRGNVDPRF